MFEPKQAAPLQANPVQDIDPRDAQSLTQAALRSTLLRKKSGCSALKLWDDVGFSKFCRGFASAGCVFAMRRARQLPRKAIWVSLVKTMRFFPAFSVERLALFQCFEGKAPTARLAAPASPASPALPGQTLRLQIQSRRKNSKQIMQVMLIILVFAEPPAACQRKVAGCYRASL